MTQLSELVEKITASPRKNPTKLIAIDGRGGSGKSTLATQLSELLPESSIVHIDDFDYPRTDRQRLIDQVLFPLKNNQTARYQRYDSKTKKLAEWHEIMPGGIVIVEGVSTLHDILFQHFDYKIWIEYPADLGYQRGLERDRNIYKVDTKDEWLNVWLPSEKKYIEEQQPQKKADYIFNVITDNPINSYTSDFTQTLIHLS